MIRTHTISVGPSIFQGIVNGYDLYDKLVQVKCKHAESEGLKIVKNVRSFGVYKISVEGTTKQINDLIKSLNSDFA